MNVPLPIQSTNLTEAWCQVLAHIVSHSGNEITPLVLTLTEFEESQSAKEILNGSLQRIGFDPIDTVAETIFPSSLYERCGFDRKKLYTRYIANLPRIKAVDKRNKRGTYFERLISYGQTEKVNQLEIIIESLNDPKNHRRSKLQASIFDPTQDHIEGHYQGFPCLQHVTFYKSETGGLILNSFYAMQYLYQRAYGNWQGLIGLGKFIAAEAGINFERFNCFIGVEKLDELTKSQAKVLLEDIKVAL